MSSSSSSSSTPSTVPIIPAFSLARMAALFPPPPVPEPSETDLTPLEISRVIGGTHQREAVDDLNSECAKITIMTIILKNYLKKGPDLGPSPEETVNEDTTGFY